MNWTEAQLTDHLKRRGIAHNSMSSETDPPSPIKAFGKLAEFCAGMNKTEAAYSRHLDSIKGSIIVQWKFEAIKLRLADFTFYTPDFMVQTVSGQIEFHETKGFWRDDARVKIKVAASLYPFRFLGITAAKGGGWDVEEF